ncbi:MAG: nucleoside phosphorylase [Bacteroidales bacterium]
MKKTELILNRDGSIFHLNLKPSDISDRIIIVGDPGRVDILAEYLSDIRVRKENREFKTVTGLFENFELTILSSGIGTDNIDIVLNELDALVNIDLATGELKNDPVSLTIVRIGTSGSLRSDIPAGSAIITETAVGFDGLLHYYSGYDWLLDSVTADTIAEHLEWPDTFAYPYAINADKELLERFKDDGFVRGITISAPGFYAPQGRILRLQPFDTEINDKLANYNFRDRKICNYEMESSAIYGLSGLLGHKALTICAIIANRVTGEFIQDYKPLINEIAQKVLRRL